MCDSQSPNPTKFDANGPGLRGTFRPVASKRRFCSIRLLCCERLKGDLADAEADEVSPVGVAHPSAVFKRFRNGLQGFDRCCFSVSDRSAISSASSLSGFPSLTPCARLTAKTSLVR